MKKTIDITTRAGRALYLTVEGCNGMIFITAQINDFEYFMTRFPQELSYWPIPDRDGALYLGCNSGRDDEPGAKIMLDEDSAKRLTELVAEAAERCEEPREYDEPEARTEDNWWDELEDDDSDEEPLLNWAD